MSSFGNQKETQNMLVEREQLLAKEAGREVVEKVKQVRNSESSVHMPSTERVERALEKGEQKLENLQNSDRGRQLGGKGQQVIEDVKRLLEDHKTLVHKNEGDLLQNILRHGQVLMQSLSEDPALHGLFTNWQNITQSIMSGNDAEGLIASGGELLKSLKNTEEFMDLVSELISMVKIFVAEKSEQLIEGESIAHPSYAHQAEKDREREKIFESLRANLNSLSSNYVWCDMIQRGRLLAHKTEIVADNAEEVSRTALEIVWEADNTQCLITDLRTLLHRIVGDTIDIDPFFDNLKAAWWDVTRNTELSSVVYELGEHMRQIAENPELADDANTKDGLKQLLSRAEYELGNLKANPAVIRAKEESRNMIEAIKKEPTSRQLIDDSLKLWNDIKSDKPGRLIDPELLAQLKSVVVPMFLQHLENVPIPVVRGVGEFLGKYDYTVENIHVSVPALMPEDIHVRFEYEMDANPLKLETSHQRTFVMLEITDMHLHIRDVYWTFSRHSVPRIHDSGRLDADTLGHGVSIRIKAEFKAGANQEQLLEVLEAVCHIDKWSIRVTDSKHDFIYEALSLMFAEKIKHEVQRSIQDKLKSFGDLANEQLHILIAQAKEKTQHVMQVASVKKAAAKQAAQQAVTGAKEASLNKTQAIQNDGAFQETKKEVKRSGKSLLTLAAEKANAILTRQQEKLGQRKQQPQRHYTRINPSIYVTPPASNTTTTNTVSLTPPYNLGNTLALSLENNFDNLAHSQSIPPTPPSSPINPLHATNQGTPLSDSSFVPESLRDVPASMRAEEIRGDASDGVTSPPLSSSASSSISSSTDDIIVTDQEVSHNKPVEAWVPTNVMPSLGFEIYPDVPSISGDSSDAKSTASNYGDEEEDVSARKQQENAAPRVVNQQGTAC